MIAMMTIAYSVAGARSSVLETKQHHPSCRAIVVGGAEPRQQFSGAGLSSSSSTGGTE